MAKSSGLPLIEKTENWLEHKSRPFVSCDSGHSPQDWGDQSFDRNALLKLSYRHKSPEELLEC